MAAEALGHEHFHGLTPKLGPRVPECPLGLGIDHDDFAGAVDHHHGIGCGLDDQPEALLGFVTAAVVVSVHGAIKPHSIPTL
jgi:hypothetical protein